MEWAEGGRCSGGEQDRAQAFREGWMRWERQGVEWQGVRKAIVVVVVWGVVEGAAGECDWGDCRWRVCSGARERR